MTPSFRDKVAKFPLLYYLAIPRRDLRTKKTKPKKSRKPRSHVRIFTYRTWAMGFYEDALESGSEFVPQNSPNLTEHRSSLEGNLKIAVKTVICKLFFIQKCRVVTT